MREASRVTAASRAARASSGRPFLGAAKPNEESTSAISLASIFGAIRTTAAASLFTTLDVSESTPCSPAPTPRALPSPWSTSAIALGVARVASRTIAPNIASLALSLGTTLAFANADSMSPTFRIDARFAAFLATAASRCLDVRGGTAVLAAANLRSASTISFAVTFSAGVRSICSAICAADSGEPDAVGAAPAAREARRSSSCKSASSRAASSLPPAAAVVAMSRSSVRVFPRAISSASSKSLYLASTSARSDLASSSLRAYVSLDSVMEAHMRLASALSDATSPGVYSMHTCSLTVWGLSMATMASMELESASH